MQRKKISEETKNKIEEYIKNNPKASYLEFKEAKNIKISDRYYYYLRKQTVEHQNNNDKSNSEDSKNNIVPFKQKIYSKIFSVPEELITEESKKLLEEFINVLNRSKRTKMEIIGYENPRELEIREAI